MSFISLSLILERNKAEETEVDAVEAARQARRQEIVSGETLRQSAELLYFSCLTAIQQRHRAEGNINHGYAVFRYEMPLSEIVPTVVIQTVKQRFAKYGWQVEHLFCDAYHLYDWLDMRAPSGWQGDLPPAR